MAKQTNSLDSHIHEVIARAVHEAVEAFRRNILDEVTRAIGAPTASAAPATKRAVVAAPRAAAPPAAAPAAPAAGGKRTWPTCTKTGCTNKFFGPSGDARLCYQHYLEAGGKHPNQAKAAPKAAAKPAAKPAAKAVATPAAKPVATPAAKPAAKPAAAKGKRGGGKASSPAAAGGALLAQVLELIGKSAGLRAEQISKQLGAKPDPVKAVLAQLRESGKVKVSGKARGTSYSV